MRRGSDRDIAKERPLSRLAVMEPRKHYDIANVLAAMAVLCFLAAAVILLYWISHRTAPPSGQVPPSTTVL